MAVIDDILTAAKNIVTAINGLGTTYSRVEGNQTSQKIASSATQVFTGQGRVVRASVTKAGTTDAALYDSSNTASITKPIGFVPKAGNIIEIGIPVINGLVVVPGTGQELVIIYSKE